MKKEDKLLLLIELIGYDVSNFAKEKHFEFINSELMFNIRNLIKKNKNSKSPKYLIAQREYEKIKNMKTMTIKEYFICYSKALKILFSLQSKEFVNPLMCSKSEENTSLSALIIDFDGKSMTLGDIIMLETYSDNYKIDALKRQIISWKQEVDDSFVRPLQLLLTYPKNLPLKKKIPLNKKFIGVFLFCINIAFIVSFFVKDNYICPILHFNYENYYISIPYYVLFSLTVLYDFCYTFLLLKRYNEHSDYLYAQNRILFNSRKIIKRIDRKTQKLYKKMLKCLIGKNEIKGEVKSFSIKESDIEALEYLKSENKNPQLSDDHVSNYEIVLLELIGILLFYFISIVILKNIGVVQ